LRTASHGKIKKKNNMEEIWKGELERATTLLEKRCKDQKEKNLGMRNSLNNKQLNEILSNHPSKYVFYLMS